MRTLEINQNIWDEYMKSKNATLSDPNIKTYKVYNSNNILFIYWLYKNHKTATFYNKYFINNVITILEEYIMYCRTELGNNNRTINNKITALSSLYLWAVKRDKVKHHPFLHKLDRLKCTDTDKRRTSYFLSRKEIEKVDVILEMNNEKSVLVDRILWGLFTDSGARISAIQNIKMEQINVDDMVIRDVREKGGKIVDLLFFDHICELIKTLKVQEPNRVWLFENRAKDGPLTQSTIRHKIKRFGNLIGYHYNLYPHTLRKTAINILYSNTDIDTASEFANHESSSTTKGHYVDKKNNKELRSKIRSAMK